MKKIAEVIKTEFRGMHYGNRLLLPFNADILKIIIENDIITDFSCSENGAQYTRTENYTEIYFHDYQNLEDIVTKYEMIKMVVVEAGDDIFNFANHKKIILRICKDHIVKIEWSPEDIIFIE